MALAVLASGGCRQEEGSDSGGASKRRGPFLGVLCKVSREPRPSHDLGLVICVRALELGTSSWLHCSLTLKPQDVQPGPVPKEQEIDTSGLQEDGRPGNTLGVMQCHFHSFRNLEKTF